LSIIKIFLVILVHVGNACQFGMARAKAHYFVVVMWMLINALTCSRVGISGAIFVLLDCGRTMLG